MLTHPQEPALILPHSQPSPIAHLPFDVVLHLLSYLDPTSIASLLSTCRSLSRWAKEESIWRPPCLAHGVRTVENFPNKSWYWTYTRFLHCYSGLLGLWASDMPYKGNVLEFRIDQGSMHQPGGIWGYAWRFPVSGEADDSEDEEDDGEGLPVGQIAGGNVNLNAFHALGIPHRPRLRKVIRIGFEDPAIRPDDAPNSPAFPLAQYRIHDKPHISCFSQSEPLTPVHPPTHSVSTVQRHAVEMYVVPNGSREGYIVSHPYGTSGHPTFPPLVPVVFDNGGPTTSSVAVTRWIDMDRVMPRLSRIAVPSSSSQAHAPRYPITIHGEPSHVRSPPGLSIQCAQPTCPTHVPAIPFRLERPFPPLYFPLRAYSQPGKSPTCPSWTPESLTGLWLGAYGPHGTEVLFVECGDEQAAGWHKAGKVVRATKVTGDVNVPRGSWTWVFYAGEERALASDQIALEVRDVRRCRTFVGRGMTSSHGFFDGRQAQSLLDVAITGPNTLKIEWLDLDHVSTYRRYRGPRP